MSEGAAALQADLSWRYNKPMATLGEALAVVKETKDEGNACYKKRDFDRAVAFYRIGLAKLRSARSRKLAEKEVGDAARRKALAKEAADVEVSLHLNTAMCLVKTGQWEDAIAACTPVLRSNPANAKALLYRSRAMMSSPHRVDGPERARRDLEAAHAAHPKDKTIKAELDSLRRRQGEAAAAKTGLSEQDLDREEAVEADEKLRRAFQKPDKASQSLFHDERSSSQAKKEQRQQQQQQQQQQAEALQAPMSDAERAFLEERARQRAAAAEAMAREAAEDAAIDAAIEAGDGAGGVVKLPASHPSLAGMSGYVTRADGSKVPSWSAADSGGGGGGGGGGSGGMTNAPPPPPQRIPSAAADGSDSGGAASASAVSFNRGYKERDMTGWCVRRLLESVLTPVAVALPGAGGHLRTFVPRDVRGEALMAGTRGKWDHTFDLSFSVGWEAKVGKPRTAEVEMKGKKQKMFLGVPTFHGHLRFADVSHLQDASEYDVEVLWGGDGPKEELPCGETKDLLRKLLLDRPAACGAKDDAGEGEGEGEGACLPAFFKQRLAAFVEAYRGIDDPQAAIDELLRDGLEGGGEGQSQQEKQEEKAGGDEGGEATKEDEGDKTNKDDKADKNDVQEGGGGGGGGGGQKEEQEKAETSEAAAAAAATTTTTTTTTKEEEEELASRPALASPWSWITVAELDAEPEDRRDDPFKKNKKDAGAETEATTGEPGSLTDRTQSDSSSSSGSSASSKDAPVRTFNPLETPRMLNYFDKLQKEGYAVMVGSGEGEKKKEGEKKEKKKKKKKGKKKTTTKGSEEKSISEAVRDRVAATMGSSNALGGMGGGVGGGVLGQQQPGPPEMKKPPEEKKRPPERAPASAATKASLDYSRFADIGDDDSDSDQEAYTEELRGALGLGGGMGGGKRRAQRPDDSRQEPVYEIDETQMPESLKSNELWNVVLGIAGGDVAKAMELVKDPEELQKHPEMLRRYAEEVEASGSDEEGSEEGSGSGSDEEEDSESDEEDEG